jgi:DNA-binding winged helix-turn-helix (wHTH) protein
VEIGTRLLGHAEAEQSADEPTADSAASPPRGEDGTLLAVVPIPGTGTSLAIVGYPVSAPGSASIGSPAPDAARERAGLLLDHDQRRVWVDGREVALTFQEFELLAFLSAHPATVFSRSDLVRRVWQRDFAADSRTVDVHVSRLRHKLGPAYGRYLVTEYRVGYQFRPPIHAVLQLRRIASHPEALGPALVMVMRSSTRCCDSIAARYSSQSGCSPEILR